MTPRQRRDRIVELVRQHERMSVDALAEQLAASRETIRRDLAELDGRGWLRKVHGGASLPEPGSQGRVAEGPFSERLRENGPAKRAIARRAAALFRPGDSLFVDTGTTTLCFAEELALARGLTVITNSTPIAALAARGEGSTVFLIGGRYRESGGENLGPIAIEQLQRFHALHAVLTIGAIGRDGVSDFDEAEAEIARMMIRQARSVTVLADGSKFAGAGIFSVAPLAEIDRLVTDAPPPAAMADRLIADGVEVLLAGAAT
ncbi:DeoR/GlpR family DNA-binding transcription regulator [Ancylobacter sp. 6x-1]|uniref:DeoR/GlpR family DNA-binding transcription regulator n=1 Tax=Ancylobacter crimeensis TaxID=2579147 RepID=A0ABT0D9Z4_9HYPH|nr:DeoR/GlpR family DNA-binding transcription regulator [Ancylobacter crimeensis]MCK0196622.1 DeoR/GlpR family DNA-binding transcription regulator [Ancylobacter crimeensis]